MTPKSGPSQSAALVTAVSELRNKDLSYSDIGRQLNISTAAAQRAARQAGFTGRVESSRHDKQAPIIKGLRDRGLTYEEIARQLDLSVSTVRRIAQRVGLTSPDARSEQRATFITAVKELRDKGLTYQQIGEHLDVSYTKAREAGAEAGLPSRLEQSARQAQKHAKRLAAVSELRQKGLSYENIGKQLGISTYTAVRAGKEAGFVGRVQPPRRVRSR